MKTSPFFARALIVLAVVLALPLVAGHLLGKRYSPQALAPSTAEVDATAHFVVVFGNSLTEAAVDPDRLALRLSAPGAPVAARAYSGGAWNALHYYQLALLNRSRLRPGRDLAIIEVSPFSLDDSSGGARLSAIRPETAASVIALPGLPTEDRLDIALGAVAGLYRYRLQLRTQILQPRIESATAGVTRGLEAIGLVGDPRRREPFQVVPVPGRNFLVQEIRGDLQAFRAINRSQYEHELSHLRLGDFRLEALRRATRLLRSRGIAVYLLEVPHSRWLDARLVATNINARYEDEIAHLAQESGAVWLRDSSPVRTDDGSYWDDKHMLHAGSGPYTDDLAKLIAPDEDHRIPAAESGR